MGPCKNPENDCSAYSASTTNCPVRFINCAAGAMGGTPAGI